MNILTGDDLRKQRKLAKMTQVQLAQVSHISQATISLIESGQLKPTANVLRSLTMALEGALVEVEPIVQDVTLSGHYKAVDWIVEGYAARGAVTMISGAAGAGKSMVTQSLATAVLRGTPWFGNKAKKGRVLIIDAENGPHLVQSRLRGMGLTAAEASRLSVKSVAQFDIERNADKFIGWASAQNYSLIVLDSWVSLWEGSETHIPTVKRFLNLLREVARFRNVGVILIHHNTKNQPTYRGTGAIAGTIEMVYTLSRDRTNNAARILACNKNRLAPEPLPINFLIHHLATANRISPAKPPVRRSIKRKPRQTQTVKLNVI